MQEREVKILEVNVAAVKKELERLGAQCVFDGVMDVATYDFPDRRLEKDGCSFRLRSRGAGGELTLKKIIENKRIKIAEETEVAISDIDQMKTILQALKLREIKHYQKHRASYQLMNIHFEFDTLPGIPTFLEIEGSSEEEIFVWVRKLGFSEDEAKP
ncbi:MAG: class IV adenylate cyclase [Patescibacteria group bacterium]|jgi:adenylate cyclase class 2